MGSEDQIQMDSKNEYIRNVTNPNPLNSKFFLYTDNGDLSNAKFGDY